MHPRRCRTDASRRLSRLQRGLDYAEDISEYNRILAEIRQLRALLIRAL